MTRMIALDEVAGLAGQELGLSEWHVVTQAQIDLFAEATGDFEWFHVDVLRAEREMGGTIAHGFLTLSIVPALWGQIARITGFRNGYNYGLDKTRFTAPVKTGARIRLRDHAGAAEKARWPDRRGQVRDRGRRRGAARARHRRERDLLFITSAVGLRHGLMRSPA